MKKLAILYFMIFAFFGFSAFSKQNRCFGKDYKFSDVIRVGTISAESMTHFGISQYHKRDIDKYQIGALDITEETLRSAIPVGIGIALLFVSGPFGCLPIAVGIGNSIKAFYESLKRKEIKNLVKGSLLYLMGDKASETKRDLKKIDLFLRFYYDVRDRLRDQFLKGATDDHLKIYLASRLLFINRYGFLIANRFNYDPVIRKQAGCTKAPLDGRVKKKFLKKNIVPLIYAAEKILEEISPEKLELIAFGGPACAS